MVYYNHNKHYADLLLQQIPPSCCNALDIGCGDGDFARRVASRYGIAVTGIDPDREMVQQAQAITRTASITFVEDDFMQCAFAEQFDFISASASLHHMPFDQALEKMVSLLRPGGVLAVLGVFREGGLADLCMALIASPINTFYALSQPSSSNGKSAPTRSAEMSLREIRKRVARDLPAARLKRLLLWRYLLTWQKPEDSQK